MNAVYRSYGRLVFAVCRRVLPSTSLAEEATQHTFVKAWHAASSFDANRELGPWLATIARRTALDIHRREARRAAVSLDEAVDRGAVFGSVDHRIESAVDVWAVRQAIDELPDDERIVVRLQHVEGYTHAEVAEQLGLPLGTVKSRSFRAHRRLAAALGHLEGGES